MLFNLRILYVYTYVSDSSYGRNVFYLTVLLTFWLGMEMYSWKLASIINEIMGDEVPASLHKFYGAPIWGGPK